VLRFPSLQQAPNDDEPFNTRLRNMNWKIIIPLLLTGLLAFVLGWFFHDMKYFADGIVADGKPLDNLQKVNP